MVTRLKPQRVKSSNSPQVGQNLWYEDSNNFKWQNTWSGVWDMKYSDFEWETLTWNAITIEDISNNITPSSNFTVSAGTVKPGIEYVLRVNTGNTQYTMTLWTGVINPNWYKTELKLNTVNQFKFIATSTSQLELEWVDSSIVSEIDWGEIGWTLANQTDLKNALDAKADNLDLNTKTFYLSDTSDLTNAQAAYDWYLAGNNPIIQYKYSWKTYPYTYILEDNWSSSLMRFKSVHLNKVNAVNSSYVNQFYIEFTISSGNVTAISNSVMEVAPDTLATNYDYPTPYNPLYDWSPATKKYVDDNKTTVVDNLNSSSSTDALSANQWNVLNSKINDLMGLGKFLSLWDCSTWQPISFPLATPYTYTTWDYFLVETVSSATPPVNYKPTGSSYTGAASSTAETDEVEVWDIYIYDWSTWLLQLNHGKTVSFANIAWQPSDNTNLANALNSKADDSDVNTKTFYLSSTSDTTNAQSAYDRASDGKNALVVYSWDTYIPTSISSTQFVLRSNKIYQDGTNLKNDLMTMTVSSDVVTWITVNTSNVVTSGLPLNNTISYTPSNNYNPATKKYVDDNMTDAVKYIDFEESQSVWATVQMNYFTKSVTPTANITVTAWTLKPRMQYILRVNSGATAYTMSLGTWVTNPFWEDLTLTASKTTTVVFLATSSSTLEVFSVRTES